MNKDKDGNKDFHQDKLELQITLFPRHIVPLDKYKLNQIEGTVTIFFPKNIWEKNWLDSATLDCDGGR